MRKNWFFKSLTFMLAVVLMTSIYGPINAIDVVAGSDKEEKIEAIVPDKVASEKEDVILAQEVEVAEKELAKETEVALSSEKTTTNSASFTFTHEDQLLGIKDYNGNLCFQDEAWRTAVFKAVKDGQDNAVGADAIEALANFTGDIKANKKGISDVHGLDLLRRANFINLEHNKIEDLSYFGQNSGDINYKSWFGVSYDDAEDRDQGTNVYWSLGGNPFTKLPENFGGRLVIKQAGTTSYQYADDIGNLYTYLRSDTKDGTVSGKINVNKTKLNIGGVWVNAKLESVGYITPTGQGYSPINITGFDHVKNDYATFDGLQRSSSIVKLAVGIDQELHYWTEDEYGTSTPGSQSFKYYISERFQIYDKIIVSDEYDGAVKLMKKNEEGKSLAGSKFKLYKKDGSLYSNKEYVSDAKGIIEVKGLALGDYYFKETAAPDQYLLSKDKFTFTILAPEGIATSIGGGETEITPSNSNKAVKAAVNERFMVGPNKVDVASPDITLTKGTAAKVTKVILNYTYDNNGTKEVVKNETFTTLELAQTRINELKNKNQLLGDVKVAVHHEAANDKEEVQVEAVNKKVQLKDIKVEKEWIDHEGWEGTPPAITIRLYRDGREIDQVELKYPRVTHTFKELPKTDQNGNEYTYTIKEDTIISQGGMVGYVSTIKPSEFGFKITNVWNENDKFNLNGIKKWDDLNNVLDSRPDSVNIVLKRNGEEIAHTFVSAKDGWQFSFVNLPIYESGNNNANKYTYTLVEEFTNQNYQDLGEIIIDTKGLQANSIKDITITNKLNKEVNMVAEISGRKIWQDYNDVYKLRPDSIVVELLRNGKATGKTQKVVPNIDGSWKYAFTKLAKYDSSGVEYVYSVKEKDVPNMYVSRVEGTDIFNKIDPSKNETSLEVLKTWDDFNNALETRPAFIDVRLLQNGKEYKTARMKPTTQIPWRVMFNELAKFDDKGMEYQYRVEEIEVPSGYTVKSTLDEKVAMITNTLDREVNNVVSISIKKEWLDKGNEFKRPSSLKVTLKQNDELLQMITLNVANNWNTTITKLPKYDDEGVEIVYAVEEEKIADYMQTEKSWQRGESNSWMGAFTNTYVRISDPKTPETGDTTRAQKFILFTLLVISLGGIGTLLSQKLQKNCKMK